MGVCGGGGRKRGEGIVNFTYVEMIETPFLVVFTATLI